MRWAPRCTTVAAPRNAQQLDAVTQLLGVANIVSFQLADTLDMRAVKLHRNAKGECRQNSDLVRGIHTFHVKCWVGFGVAQALGILQGVDE